MVSFTIRYIEVL